MTVTANSIITPQGPLSNHIVQAFTANTTYTSTPTNTVLLVTFGPNGGRLTRMDATPTATVTATQIQAFRSLDSGTTKKFIPPILGAPSGYTMAGTTVPPKADFGYSDDNPMIGGPNESVYVGVGVSGSWSFEAEWANY